MTRFVFDVETDGVKYTRIWCIVVQNADTEELFSFGPNELPDAITLLNTADTLIGHNILTFDIPCVRKIMNEPDFAKGKEI